jgi:hypothetical protein
MTTCTPLKPFRCWQYRKDSGEAVPEWCAWLAPSAWTPWQQRVVLDGKWIVESCEHSMSWYTPAEFAERFKIVPAQYPGQTNDESPEAAMLPEQNGPGEEDGPWAEGWAERFRVEDGK